MKVLNFEDSVYKANAIRKVLNQCGVAKIELVSNVEDGLQMLKNAEDTGDPFDLIITDMHYPMKQGAVSDTEAGEKAGSAPAGAGQTDKGYRMLIQKYEASRSVWLYLVFGNQ